MSLVLDTGTMKYRQNPNQPWRPLVIKAGMNWESMADTYDPDNGTYEVGQYVLEEGMMYRCISEITTPEAWTPAHWTSVNVGDELSSFIIISDDQPTDETNKIWIAETTAPFGVQIPTMDDHNALGNTLTQLGNKVGSDSLDTTAQTVVGAVNEINAALPVAPYKKKKYILTGDSYMSIGTGLGQQIVDITGIDAIIFTEGGGGGFVGRGGQYTFLEGLQEVVSRMPAADRDEICNGITDIYVFGGWNDYNIASSDILTAMGAFDTYVKTRFPNALVTLAVVAYASRIRSAGPTDLALIERNVIPTYSYGSSEYGWGFIPYANSAIHYPDAISSDGTHPITTEEIARYVSRYITSGSVYYNSRLTNSLVPYNNTISSGSMTLDTALIDGKCTIINRDYAGFVFASAFSFSGDLAPANRTVIGTYNGFAQGIEENGTPTIAIPLRIRGVWINNTDFHDCDGILWISYGYIYLSLRLPTEVGSGAFTSSSFAIPPFSFTLPSDLC